MMANIRCVIRTTVCPSALYIMPVYLDKTNNKKHIMYVNFYKMQIICYLQETIEIKI